jgi:hypothetical protein
MLQFDHLSIRNNYRSYYSVAHTYAHRTICDLIITESPNQARIRLQVPPISCATLTSLKFTSSCEVKQCKHKMMKYYLLYVLFSFSYEICITQNARNQPLKHCKTLASPKPTHGAEHFPNPSSFSGNSYTDGKEVNITLSPFSVYGSVSGRHNTEAHFKIRTWWLQAQRCVYGQHEHVYSVNNERSTTA